MSIFILVEIGEILELYYAYNYLKISVNILNENLTHTSVCLRNCEMPFLVSSWVRLIKFFIFLRFFALTFVSLHCLNLKSILNQQLLDRYQILWLWRLSCNFLRTLYKTTRLWLFMQIVRKHFRVWVLIYSSHVEMIVTNFLFRSIFRSCKCFKCPDLFSRRSAFSQTLI